MCFRSRGKSEKSEKSELMNKGDGIMKKYQYSIETSLTLDTRFSRNKDKLTVLLSNQQEIMYKSLFNLTCFMDFLDLKMN